MKTPAVKTCPSCQEKNDPDARWCPYCGHGKPAMLVEPPPPAVVVAEPHGRALLAPDPPAIQRVSVVDFTMTIESMVIFMLKWAIASIPALIVLAGVMFLIGMLLSVILR